jgi:hypothetical protein
MSCFDPPGPEDVGGSRVRPGGLSSPLLSSPLLPVIKENKKRNGKQKARLKIVSFSEQLLLGVREARM